jgi:hypothetical protein
MKIGLQPVNILAVYNELVLEMLYFFQYFMSGILRSDLFKAVLENNQFLLIEI